MADKHNDGIEERAAKHLRDNDLVWSVEGSLPRIVADFTVAETTTLTARVKELETGFKELLESAKHAQMETHETFTSNTLFDAVVKAEKIFDTDAQ
jgi:hypothetical protein